MDDDGSLMINGIRVRRDVRCTGVVHPCGAVDNSCVGACCSGGVWFKSEEEGERIRAWAKEIKARIPADRHDESEWFEREDGEVGTRAVSDPLRPGQTCCVFQQTDRKCALQIVSQQNQLGWPGIKPFYCAIFPLYYEDGVMSIDDETTSEMDDAACRRLAPQQRPVFELYPDEAILILGEDGYRELREKARAQD